MQDLFQTSYSAVAFASLTCLLLREAMIVLLPDRVAGPGGSFIDTDRR